ncbi:MAG: selenide, water dikinase SelD, partial [Deltaproteobacteria bacterium]|nr:selenide, water dikinase SelD [Deltaproteobacteria bacterium]
MDLPEILSRYVDLDDAKLLVNASTNDDAAVYSIDENRALVFTADFIAPTIDDPYLFGRVAAANALSDVYAMGGEPLIALNLCMFPRNLDKAAIREILRGGHEAVRESGGLLVGGHTMH